MKKQIEPIAHIKSAYTQKFGIPRQSGLVPLEAEIIFEEKYKNASALRGLEGFSHLWLIWGFSENPESDKFCPTVRPPRLGGNTRVGVFATRSPFRPNGLGLSCVKISKIEGTSIFVQGADLANGTPIYDIKPYLAYTDSHENAMGGFAEAALSHRLNVNFSPELLEILPPHLREGAAEILAQDPRPSYQNDSQRLYGITLDNYDINFTVDGENLTVVAVKPL